jgi:pimeloyl-ACP methyl ester carboxylesterase
MRVLPWLIGVLVLAAFWLFRPLPALAPPRLSPAGGYADAEARLADFARRDSIALHDGCATTTLLHGRRTPRAFVLVHGLTNCPLQFLALGAALHAQGDNVLLPRVDHHGLADRMTADLARWNAREMTTLMSECVGIARGLGDTVVVMGLSSGGVMAAWAAQTLDGVDRAVVIAPTFAPPWNAPWAVRWLVPAAARMPNAFVWWNDSLRQNLPGPTQCYPRFASHAIAEAYRLGAAVEASLARGAPRARQIALVTTEADDAIDNAEVDRVAGRWRAHGIPVTQVTFPESLAVGHDMIDPAQVGARIDLVYPALLALARGEPAPGSRAGPRSVPSGGP